MPVTKGGVYNVAVTNQCGTGYAEILIDEQPCKTVFPTAFTPNQDGKNDVFRLLNPLGVSAFHLAVMNRLGQKVFETNDYREGWNGTFKQEAAGMGTYVWFCDFLQNGQIFHLHGTVVLIR